MLTLWLWRPFPFPPVRSSGEVGWGPRTQRLTSVISGSRGRSEPWKDVSPASLYESGREHKKLEQVGPCYPLQPCLPTGLPSTPPPPHAKLQEVPSLTSIWHAFCAQPFPDSELRASPVPPPVVGYITLG